MNVRVIPRLDIKGPNLVKGVHLEGLRVLGKPEHFARHYYEGGADELLFMDAVASLYERNSLLDIVERTAREIFIPLCVGGGLRSIDDVATVLRKGADKVSINTAALRRPEMIDEVARRFGSSTVVVSIDAIKQADGSYECFTEGGREPTGRDAVGWAIEAAERGAGELLVTSIDREGTGKGFETDLITRIATSVPVPVIACGGAGTLDHVVEVVEVGKADAVCLASLLHYGAISDLDFSGVDFSEEGNIDFRRTGRGVSQISVATVHELKSHLAASGIQVRAELER